MAGGASLVSLALPRPPPKSDFKNDMHPPPASSSRCGFVLARLRLLHLRDEAGEEVMAVLGAGRGFRMILYGEDGPAFKRNAAIRAVEERHMCLDHAFGQARPLDGEAMVHGRDLDLAGREVLDRMIGAVMALMHLRRLGAERDRQHLMSEADAEERLAGLDELADLRNRIVAGRRRIAGAVRQEYAVGIEGENFFRSRGC